MQRLLATTISSLNSTAGIAAAALLLLAVLLGAGAPSHAADGRANRQIAQQRIREMTQVERDRLQSNYKTFLALPEEKQNAYRQIRTTIEDDERQGGSLHRVAKNYHRWLKTLSLWQRDELRNQADPYARMKLVRRFRRQQQENSERQRLGPVGGWKRFSRLLSQPVPTLSSDDFHAVMQTLERKVHLRSNGSRKGKKLIPAPLKHLRVLMAAVPKRRRGENHFNGFDEQTVAALIESITDVDIRTQITGETLIQRTLAGLNDAALRERLQNVPPSDWQRYFLVKMILQALHAEWRAEFNKRKPTGQQSEKFFQALSQRQQNEVISRSGYEQKRQLAALYMQKHFPDWAREYRELRWLLPRLIPQTIARALHQRRGNRPNNRANAPSERRLFRKGNRPRRKPHPDRNGPPPGDAPPPREREP